MNRTMCAWAVIGMLGFGGIARADDALEVALVRQADLLIKQCKVKGYANVGVLKFLVAKDGKPFSDNVGTLNMTLAQRLELALLLKNDARAPVGIIQDASAVAARTKGANHLSREGRLKLFDARYPLAWGKQEVAPDAFFTGAAQVSPDLRTLKITLMMFDRTENSFDKFGESFVVANRGDLLGEVGESFTLRGAFDGGEVQVTPVNVRQQQEKILTAAVQVKKEQAVNPLQDPAAPIKLEIRYDGNTMPVEFRDGRAFVAEPRQGQRVTFVLGRNNTKARLGVVLKVNGENTFEHQTLPDARCRMWVLDPGEGPYEIPGYQGKNDTAEAFRVLSASESREREINYGRDVGTVTLTVFRELTGRLPPPGLSDEAQNAAVVEKTQLSADRADNYDALVSRLLLGANRGIIAEGPRIGNQVRIVNFMPDPTSEMSGTVFYYRR